VNRDGRCLAQKLEVRFGGGTEIRGGGSDDLTVQNGNLQLVLY
jgi:hypothetical protein